MEIILLNKRSRLPNPFPSLYSWVFICFLFFFNGVNWKFECCVNAYGRCLLSVHLGCPLERWRTRLELHVQCTPGAWVILLSAECCEAHTYTQLTFRLEMFIYVGCSLSVFDTWKSKPSNFPFLRLEVGLEIKTLKYVFCSWIQCAANVGIAQ